MLGASLVHHGEELLWQGAGAGAYADTRAFMGIPFLHPWANRLERFGYRAGGHDVLLDPTSPLLLLDDNGLPIHGLLNATRRWSVSAGVADADRASLTAILNFDDPDLLAAFPFPHRLEMTVALSACALEVKIILTPTSEEPVPIAFGFHPYIQLHDAPRGDWEVEFPVRRRLPPDARMLPTGAREAASPITGAIGGRTWDDGYDRLGSPARFVIRSVARTVQIDFVRGYPVAQIFAPPGQPYLCVEPMTAPVNALTAADRSLRWVRPGQSESAVFRLTTNRVIEHCAPARARSPERGDARQTGAS